MSLVTRSAINRGVGETTKKEGGCGTGDVVRGITPYVCRCVASEGLSRDLHPCNATALPFPGVPPPPSVVRHLVHRARDGSSATVPSAGCHCQARAMRRRGTRESTCVFGEGKARVWGRMGSWGWRRNGRLVVDTESFGEWCRRFARVRVWYGTSRDGDVRPFVTRRLGLVLSVRCAAAETLLAGTLMIRAANRRDNAPG